MLRSVSPSGCGPPARAPHTHTYMHAHEHAARRLHASLQPEPELISRATHLPIRWPGRRRLLRREGGSPSLPHTRTRGYGGKGGGPSRPSERRAGGTWQPRPLAHPDGKGVPALLLPATHAPHGRRACGQYHPDAMGTRPPRVTTSRTRVGGHGTAAAFEEERAASQPQLPRMWADMGGWPDARSEHPQRGLAGNATIILSGTGLAR